MPRPPRSQPLHKLTLNVPIPVHQSMVKMAEERDIPLTDLMRRSFNTFRQLASDLADTDSSLVVVLSDGTRFRIDKLLPLGLDAW